MNVYELKYWDYPYGGMMMIAANTKKQAKQLCIEFSLSFMMHDVTAKKLGGLSASEPARIIAYSWGDTR